MRIVFDTNIYIAAFRTKGFLFELLTTVLDRKNGYFLFISPDIKHELERKLAEKFNLTEIKDYISIIERFGYLAAPIETIKAVQADPDDNKILECAVAAEADLIVSMDKHLLRLKTFRRIAIVHPKTFSFMLPSSVKGHL